MVIWPLVQVGLDLSVGQEYECGHEAGLFAVEKESRCW